VEWFYKFYIFIELLLLIRVIFFHRAFHIVMDSFLIGLYSVLFQLYNRRRLMVLIFIGVLEFVKQ